MKVRRNARLAAVQVIFQYYFSKSDINKIIRDFSKFNEDFLKTVNPDLNSKFLSTSKSYTLIREKKIVLVDIRLYQKYRYYFNYYNS